MKTCQKCGAENQDSARFCGMCRTGFRTIPPKTATLPKFFWVYAVIGIVVIGMIVYFSKFHQDNDDSAMTSPDVQSPLSVDVLDKKGSDAFNIRDYTAAMNWYRKAAAKGDAAAENFIGWFYQNGLGVGKDYAEAMKWYMKAANQGLTSAETNVGWCYQNALGVNTDYREALKWYSMAAKQGNPDAENNMGFLCENGIGVTKDYEEAKKWYQLAADHGHAEGKRNLENLKLKMVNLNALLHGGPTIGK
jgi:TPR repeat protein